MQSPPFLAGPNVVELFLGVLSFLHKENPDQFGLLESMEERKRKYISKSEQELENSGINVNAKRIPSTSYRAVTKQQHRK